MDNAISDTDATIEALLQQRARFEQWLARLDSAGEKAPPAVRAKVRGDYEARLRGVIDELRGHAATIAQELDRHKRTQDGLDQQRRRAEEELSEAEVRHVVGEYTDEEWQGISEKSGERLGGLRTELRGVGEEIARLAEVQSLIGGSRPRAPEPPPVEPPAEPEPEPEPVVQAPPPPAAKAAPKAPSAPPPREPEITHGTPHGDELEFLKSVAPEEERKPAQAAPSRRASNPGPSSGGSATRTSEAPPASAGQTAAPGKPGAPGVAKTLKCGECGTLNRPTEWYCERCGAELAGV
ncbi:MAG: hypothetical protein ABIQ49_13320 [Gemmatimonadales bacterium]